MGHRGVSGKKREAPRQPHPGTPVYAAHAATRPPPLPHAERHKAAMLKAENLLEYDYSDGWTANFDEQPAGELEEAQV